MGTNDTNNLPATDPRVGEFAERIYRGLKERLGDAWQNRLSDDERKIPVVCVNDAAGVHFDSLAGRPGQAAEVAQITAQLANLQSLGEGRAARLFWGVVREVAMSAIGVTFAVL